MTTRVQERVEVLRDERGRAIRAATNVAMIGLLVGLSTFFVTLAPHVWFTAGRFPLTPPTRTATAKASVLQ